MFLIIFSTIVLPLSVIASSESCIISSNLLLSSLATSDYVSNIPTLRIALLGNNRLLLLASLHPSTVK